MRTSRRIAVVLLIATIPGAVMAQDAHKGEQGSEEAFFELPELEDLLRGGMRELIERYGADLRLIQRFYDARPSSARAQVLGELHSSWLQGLRALDFDALGQDDQIDYLLFQNKLRHQLRSLALQSARELETQPLVSFAQTIVGLQESRRRLELVDPESASKTLVLMTSEIKNLERRVRAGMDTDQDSEEALRAPRPVINRALGEVRQLAETLSAWHSHYDGYDPQFSWWVSEPYRAAKQALDQYGKFLSEEVLGVKAGDRDTIIGDPIGREALIVELQNEMIVYAPEELLQIAESEFRWCEKEMLRAAADLGFGEDWKAALEHVKGLHVAPGEQPRLVRDLAWEAIAFLEQNELVTIPLLAKRGWRMEMMSPERQKFTPFFTGGEVLSVAFPTDSMEHAEKRMSLRSNNIHFSRATVHHELIPGHHLQGFMRARHRTYRRTFGTPFWLEGWALYWEMLLWDLEFQRSAEDRVGMLFWRMHRCARVLFSLGFELGELQPDECIEMLIERVGHEPATAEAEVRRSVQGGYPPLYQAAYMLGGLQIRALHRELLQGGKWSNREFHDAVLRENSIPIEMLRAKLLGLDLSPEFQPSWRFYPK